MNLKLSEAAVNKIKSIFTEQNVSSETTYLRVGIKGHSCSGPVYAFYLDEEYAQEDDELILQNEIKIICDKEYVSEFSGITINYHEKDGKTGFSFDNPLKVVSGCCGGKTCQN